MYKERRFSEEQLREASNVNIIALAKNRGYDVRKVTPRSYKIPGYGGLYIKGDGTKWNWFSRGKGGGAIQFLMELENISCVDAVKELLDIPHDALPQVEPPPKDIDEKRELVLPRRNSTYKHIFAYLIYTRKIHGDVVQEFVKNKQLYEDEKRNCVFVGYNNENEPKFASLRGTGRKQFRKDLWGSDKTYPFHREGTNDTLLIFESPIDLMSYMTLAKIYKIKAFHHHMISMGGTSYLPIEYYTSQHPAIKKMILCLDNDQEGHFFSQQIQERFGERFQILKHLPTAKDFNEDLIVMHNRLNDYEKTEGMQL
ncbi:DUF3991 domain-containing protein [Maledivibacter halophilus]|uniref:DNA primase (Bacterial type) n=1 Tax=Maledivibacter halophilus TaxID=36842 RepID=A0A1T5LPK7_9FIRM|nr:DUF3991 domain-containing protein [Maledivibacter halophilus]SKC77841.1 DNA primase (bacterial type) [Maledivibacter halophilus]